jgi:hypothetical protein
MAGIAVGDSDQGNTFWGEGHAPEANLVDVSVTEPPPPEAAPSPFDALAAYRNRWTATDLSILNAIQMLRTWILGAPGRRVDVLNISFDGWSDPWDPVAAAYDDMAVAHDMLLVTSCGNLPDDTEISNGFYNGLAVGSVHTRTYSTQQFPIMRESARGPLHSDLRRYFPDVSGTGAGHGFQQANYVAWPLVGTSLTANPTWADLQVKMPIVDVLDADALDGDAGSWTNDGGTPPRWWVDPFGCPVPQGELRFGRGTSEAAAQVSGAAALYVAARRHLQPNTISAQEVRAALLASTIGGAQGDYAAGTQQATGNAQTAYSSRNTVGVGYVRDDLLAELAVRSASNPIQALHSRLTFTTPGTTQVVSYPSFTPGGRYVAVIAWPRDAAASLEYAYDHIDDVDLTVVATVNAAMVTVARSWSPANTYERVAFVVPSGATAVDLHVTLRNQPLTGPLVVDLIARRFEPDRDLTTPSPEATPVVAASGFYERADAGAACVGPARSLQPFRAIPAAYADAYGSAAFNVQTPTGFRLRDPGTVHPNWGPGIHIVIRNTQAGPPTTIGGLAFRKWRPLGAFNQPLTVKMLRLDETPGGSLTTADYNHGWFTGSGSNGTTVLTLAGGTPREILPVGYQSDWVPGSFDEFSLLIPFDTPYAYQGGNLHVYLWVDQGDVLVDGTSDGGDPNYGSSVQTTLGYGPGITPVMALLPSPTSQSLNPELRLFGEPLLGTSLEAQMRHVPAGATVMLTFGTWAPNAVPGVCTQHIIAPFYTSPAFADAFGFARWTLTLPTDMPWIHDGSLAMQGVVFTSPQLFTNAARAVLGGGL